MLCKARNLSFCTVFPCWGGLLSGCIYDVDKSRWLGLGLDSTSAGEGRLLKDPFATRYYVPKLWYCCNVATHVVGATSSWEKSEGCFLLPWRSSQGSISHSVQEILMIAKNYSIFSVLEHLLRTMLSSVVDYRAWCSTLIFSSRNWWKRWVGSLPIYACIVLQGSNLLYSNVAEEVAFKAIYPLLWSITHCFLRQFLSVQFLRRF